MSFSFSSFPLKSWAVWLALSVALVPGTRAQGNDRQVYRCPGKPVLYTDSLTSKEARDKGCTALDGAPITVIAPAPKSQAAPAVRAAPPSGNAGRGGESRIDPADQRARDSDARKILEAELRKEEESLAALKKDFNSGEPERQGDERNYQKYLDRVAEMKASVARKESDIAALKRELAKLK